MMTILMKGGNEATGIPRFDRLTERWTKNKDMPGKFIDEFPSI